MPHWFSTSEGKAFRNAIILRDRHQCKMCGVIVAAGRRAMNSAVVDHIKPVALRPDLERDESNCRTVCKRCHAVCNSIEARHKGNGEKIMAEKMKYRPVGLDGYPVKI